MPLDAYEQFKKDLTDVPESMPSVSQMVRYDAESYNSTIEQRRMFSSSMLFHLDEEEKERRDERMRTNRLEYSMASDLAIREHMKQQKFRPVSSKEIDKESKFREKEQSYDKKESEQEKAAIQRNEAYSGVKTEDLEDEADELRAQLALQIDETDSYAVGEREYQKQFLAVIEDLVKTRASKGKLLGNYKKHIALAEEKYLFYSRESERIIGREQAKVLMNKPEFKTELAQRSNIVPTSIVGLVPLYDKAKISERKKHIRKDAWKAAEKAMHEYNVCAEKICLLRRHIDALKAVEAAELKAKEKKLPQNEARQDAALSRSKSGKELMGYIASLETELSAWMFQADSCRMVISCLEPAHGIGTYLEGERASHAVFIKEHFGIDVMTGWWIDQNKTLRESFVSEAIGFETGSMDIAANIQDPAMKRKALDMFDKRWEARKRWAKTGYEKQSAYEMSAVEAGGFEVIDMVLQEKDPQTREEVARHTRECADMMILTQSLPALQTTRENGKNLRYDSLLFNVTRTQDGEAVSATRQRDVRERKEAIEGHLRNIEVLKKRRVSDADAKAAILAELPMVKTAFDDIDAFMSVGATRNIFTAKNHYEVYDHTAGMPTFERKARMLRDVISMMLKKKDVVNAVAAESGERDLHRKLYHKWMFLNRALSFVDYRKQLMDKGYDSTRDEWIRDTTEVTGFFEKNDYARMVGREDTQVSLKSPEITTDIKDLQELTQALDDARELEEAQAVREDVRIDVPAEDEEQSWSEEDKQKWRRWKASIGQSHEDALRKHQEREALLKGMSRTESHFLRMDFYESPAFKTRAEQREAIQKDLLKGTAHSAYYGELTAINRELESVRHALQTSQTQELRAQESTLLAQQEAAIKAIKLIDYEVLEHTETLLQTLKVPQTDYTDVEQNLTGLVKLVHTTVADGSMEEDLRLEYKSRAQAALRLLKNGQGADPNRNAGLILEAMLRSLDEQYRAAILEFATFGIRKSKEYYEQDPQGYAKKLSAVNAAAEKLSDPNIDTDTLALVAANVKSLCKDAKVETPLPAIFQVRNQTVAAINSLKSLKEGTRKTRRVQFADKTEMAEGEFGEGFAVKKAYSEELDTVHEAMSEQFPNWVEANGLANATVRDQRVRAEVTSKALRNERVDYLQRVSDLSEGPITRLQGDGEMEESVKGYLSDFISVSIPIERSKDPSFKLFDDEKDEHAEMTLLHKHILALSDPEGKTQDEVDAVDHMLPVLQSRLSDLFSYLRHEPGSKMIEARHGADLYRLSKDPVIMDNYTDDVDGMTIVGMKATQLKKLLQLTIGKMEKLVGTHPEYEDWLDGLEINMVQLDELTEFLEWRESVLKKIVGIHESFTSEAVKRQAIEQHVKEVRENPEEWQHERPAII